MNAGSTALFLYARHQLEVYAAELTESVKADHAQLVSDAEAVRASAPKKKPWNRRFYLGKVQDGVARLGQGLSRQFSRRPSSATELT